MSMKIPVWADEELAPYITIRHSDADVSAVWSFDEEAEDSLQIVYERDNSPHHPNEKFFLYLSPHSAGIVGQIIHAWGEARKING